MATLKDIAEKAGISVGTVDRIMHNRGRFSQDTAEKVRRIAQEMNYRPNLMARHLSRSVECRLVLFMPSPEQDSSYWTLPLTGARRIAADLEPFGLTLETIHYDRYSSVSFRAAAEILLRQDWDGVMMAPLRESETMELMERLGPDVPVVFFDTDLPRADRIAYVGQDSEASGRLAARLLGLAAQARSYRRIRAGGRVSHPSFVLVAPDAQNDHLDHRIRGFQEAINAPVELCVVNVESDHDTEAFRKALNTSITGETAGVFVIDASAHFVAEYMAGRFGMDPANPERPPLIGFDLVPPNRRWMKDGMIDFLLTQRPVDQGTKGVNLLFRKVFRNETGPDHEFMPIDIITLENLDYLSPEDLS